MPALQETVVASQDWVAGLNRIKVGVLASKAAVRR